MMVLAPGRFSTTTGCPQSSLIFWAMTLATMSLGPPAGKGTMMRIVRLGNAEASSAHAVSHADSMNTAASRGRSTRAITPPHVLVVASRNSRRCTLRWQPLNTDAPIQNAAAMG
jgi:hypothetical protein